MEGDCSGHRSAAGAEPGVGTHRKAAVVGQGFSRRFALLAVMCVCLCVGDESKDENQLLELLFLSAANGRRTSNNIYSYLLLLEYLLLPRTNSSGISCH